MSILKGMQFHYRLFGPLGVLLVAKSRLLGKSVEIAVAVDEISHPIHLRLRTSDVSLFEEIIVDSEYQFEPSRRPLVIVDAGANVALTSVFYANKFPQARIFAIEPESSNFAMLTKNASYYSNILPIRGALWREDATLSLSNPGTGNWGYRTRERQQDDVPDVCIQGMTVGALMKKCGCEHIDILKIDIEGAEKEVFETSASWIDSVGVIVVELHDRSRNGCSRSVYSATKDFEFEWCKGETTFFVRNEYAPIGLEQMLASTGSADAFCTATKRSLPSRVLAIAP